MIPFSFILNLFLLIGILFSDVNFVYAQTDMQYYDNGFNYEINNKLPQAIAEYDKAIKLNPNNSMAYYRQAIAYVKQHKYSQAISDYNHALEISPKNGKIYVSTEFKTD